MDLILISSRHFAKFCSQFQPDPSRGRAWRSTEENQQIFSVTEYDCKQKWPNHNEKSQLVDNAIYCAYEFKASLKTILNK